MTTKLTLTIDKDTIQKAKEGKDYFGFAGNVPSVPYITGDYDKRIEWEANVNKLLSGKILEIMNDMKQASRTGATGFGQLSNKELELLRQASTALNRRLPPDVAERYLNDMQKIHERALGISSEGSGTTPEQVNQNGSAQIPSFAYVEEAVLSGYKGPAIVAGRKARIE
jgi:hypothetical protein